MRQERGLTWFWGLCAVLGWLAVTLVTPGFASADCTNGVFGESLPITTITPANSSSFLASGSAQLDITLVSPIPAMSLFVRISSQDTVGATRTLSDLNQVDDLALTETPTGSGVYLGASNTGPTWWTNRPGRYYWQVFGTTNPSVDPTTGVVSCNAYAGPVESLNILADTGSGPQPPASAPRMSIQDAERHAASMVRKRTNRQPRIKPSCTRVDVPTIHCKLAWATPAFAYAATGKFWNTIRSGAAYWWYDFTGTRTSISCRAKHGHAPKCRQRLRWRSTATRI